MTRRREIDGSLKPAVPYLEYIDANSTAPLVPWQWYPIFWGTHSIITSDFIEKNLGNSDSVLVQTTGLYKVTLQVQIVTVQNDGNCLTHLVVNGVEVFCSQGSIWLVAGKNQTLSTTITLYLKRGDEITCEWASGVDTTDIGENSVFRIEWLPMGGWNNDSSGNVINRGIRR